MNKHRVIALVTALVVLSSILTLFGYADTVNVGDPNNDGKITSADARIALQISLRLIQYNNNEYIAADVNADGKVTSSDARIILCVSLKLYDESVIVKQTTRLSTLPRTTKETTTPTTRDINWDNLFETTTVTPTSVRSTVPRTTIHPNNYYTTTAAPPTTTPGIEIPGTVPSTDKPETPGTVPSADSSNPSVSKPTPSSGGTIIHTGTPSRPNTENMTFPTDEPTVSTTIPPTTANPDLPAFRLDVSKFSGGLVTATVYVKNSAGLKNGMVSVTYDPDTLSFVSAAPVNTIGSVNIRPDSELGSIGCEFTLNNAAGKTEFCLGTVTFRVITNDISSTVIRVAVKNDSRYNWTDSSKRPLAIRPQEYGYFLILVD